MPACEDSWRTGADRNTRRYRLTRHAPLFASTRTIRRSRFYVEIEDGREGIFDLKPYLNRGALRELRDVHTFRQIGIQFGA